MSEWSESIAGHQKLSELLIQLLSRTFMFYSFSRLVMLLYGRSFYIFNLSLLQGKVCAVELQACVCPRAGVGMLAVCPSRLPGFGIVKALDSGDVEL